MPTISIWIPLGVKLMINVYIYLQYFASVCACESFVCMYPLSHIQIVIYSYKSDVHIKPQLSATF